MMAATLEKPSSRKASKEVRKQQLIDATIKVLAHKGLAALTVADVAREAGLSTGIIIFHFISKDQLLASVLRFLVDEYRTTWTDALSGSEDTPAARLETLMMADFDPQIFTAEKLAAWITFWGEAQGRPVYDEICAAYDAERQNAGLACCKALIEAGGYALDTDTTMKALDALGDGLWLGVAAADKGEVRSIAPEEAKRVMGAALAAFFPRHFAKG